MSSRSSCVNYFGEYIKPCTFVRTLQHMNLQIDHNSKLPLHVQVEELMRNLIASPEFTNGALLPKEIELANQLGISRSTIRQATNKLQNEGLLKRKKGVGTTVARKKYYLQV